VYDVSKWKDHPGGRVIYTNAGQDATAVFTSFHSKAAWAALEPFYVGECKETVGVDNAFEREMRGLVKEMHRQGLYKSR
jgi:acyl-lipid Delta6-acetylenase / acyl-lipid (9-3)-desaturase